MKYVNLLNVFGWFICTGFLVLKNWGILDGGICALSFEILESCFLWSTPAVWSRGGTFSFDGGPCLSPSIKLRAGSAIWAALRKLASALSDAARQGVNGFGTFCSTTKVALFETHQAKPRLPGRNPAPQNITLIGGLVKLVQCVSPPQGVFYWQPPR